MSTHIPSDPAPIQEPDDITREFSLVAHKATAQSPTASAEQAAELNDQLVKSTTKMATPSLPPRPIKITVPTRPRTADNVTTDNRADDSAAAAKSDDGAVAAAEASEVPVITAKRAVVTVVVAALIFVVLFGIGVFAGRQVKVALAARAQAQVASTTGKSSSPAPTDTNGTNDNSSADTSTDTHPPEASTDGGEPSSTAGSSPSGDSPSTDSTGVTADGQPLTVDSLSQMVSDPTDADDMVDTMASWLKANGYTNVTVGMGYAGVMADCGSQKGYFFSLEPTATSYVLHLSIRTTAVEGDSILPCVPE